MKKPIAAFCTLLLLGTLAQAQENTAPVSKAELDKLRAELKAEFDTQLAAERRQFESDLANLKSSARAEVHAPRWLPGKEEIVPEPPIDVPAVALTTGSSKLILTGGASADASFVDSDSNFSAAFNPIFLWQVNDRVKVEGDIVFSDNVGVTSTQLEVAEISYHFGDYLTIGAGRFADPTNYFSTNLRKPWINKMPDSPNAYVLGPSFEDGANLRGIIPIGSTFLNYAAFGAANVLRFDSGWGFDSHPIQSVETDVNWGGRIGFQPFEGLEIGYGAEMVSFTYFPDFYGWPAGRYRWRDLIQTADLNFTKTLSCVKGTVDFHAQWGWLDGQNYDFSTNSGYAQLAYRPTQLSGLISRFEPVVRYSSYGSNPGRWTFGLDYWLADRTVIKTALYQGAGGKIFTLLQFATGF